MRAGDLKPGRPCSACLTEGQQIGLNEASRASQGYSLTRLTGEDLSQEYRRTLGRGRAPLPQPPPCVR